MRQTILALRSPKPRAIVAVALVASWFALPRTAHAIDLMPGDIVIAGAGGVSRINRDIGGREMFASFGGERGAGGLVMNAAGELYAVGAGPDSSAVYRIDPVTGALATLASVGGTGRDIEFDSSGNLLVVTGQDSGLGGSVRKVDVLTGQVTDYGAGGAAAFYDIIVESDESLLVGEFGGVSRFNLVTQTKTLLCPMIGGAAGITPAGDGTYFVSTLGAQVGRLALDSCDFNIIGAGGGTGTAIIVDNDGTLLAGVRDQFNFGELRRFDVAAGGYTSISAGGWAVNDIVLVPVPEPRSISQVSVLLVLVVLLGFRCHRRARLSPVVQAKPLHRAAVLLADWR